jgi:hypothetical protein
VHYLILEFQTQKLNIGPRDMNAVSSNCRIEIAYIDPEMYSSIVNHDMRKRILRALYGYTRDSPISKQELADRLGVGYHQLVYQLNNHLKDFWTVREERKVRGTRMELIEASKPSTVYITLGKDNGVFMVDPPANLFGPLLKIGTRCDSCPANDVANCLSYISSNCSCSMVPNEAERGMLLSNGRKMPFRPMDLAVLCAIKGIPEGDKCVLDLPSEGCAVIRQLLPKN